MQFKLLLKNQIHKQIIRIDQGISFISDNIIGTVLERDKDIVLITGGCSGLGKQIVTEFIRRNVTKIVVFDLVIPPIEEQLPNVKYFECDVSDPIKVNELKDQVKQEIGVVTILINNAGITSGESLLNLSVPSIDKIIKINLLSNFYTVKAFLPDMVSLERGYIITIASVLGYMAPANLTAYAASKSGLIAFHESLTYELGPPLGNGTGVKTLLICPGQLKTNLFKGVKTPSSILAPELEPEFVAQKLVRAIECGRRGELQFPIYGNVLPLFRSTCWPLTQLARLFSGVDQSMNSFQK